MNVRENETSGLALGVLGMLIFSLTLPMTRIVVLQMNPLLGALGRAEVAAVLAGLVLWWKRAALPSRVQFKTLGVTALGVVVGFPILSAIALHDIPASHGAMMHGLMPFAVAVYAYWFGGERPSFGFWICALVGSVIVLCYTMHVGGGALAYADLLMLASVAAGGIGYGAGGKLARDLGGWQVICWSLVLAGPMLAIPTVWLVIADWRPLNTQAWLAFGYIAVFSQFLGFFAWYAGLAAGGIARVGQVQLLQIFVTIGLSALFFEEPIPYFAWPCAVLVAATVIVGKRTTVLRVAPTLRAP
jgi:drug/metabolite transporter (DMT)-like permease